MTGLRATEKPAICSSLLPVDDFETIAKYSALRTADWTMHLA
jgi:hypothetical protein